MYVVTFVSYSSRDPWPATSRSSVLSEIEFVHLLVTFMHVMLKGMDCLYNLFLTGFGLKILLC